MRTLITGAEGRHDADGRVRSGLIDALAAAFAAGADVKVALRGLCADLAGAGDPGLDHEVFIHTQ